MSFLGLRAAVPGPGPVPGVIYEGEPRPGEGESRGRMKDCSIFTCRRSSGRPGLEQSPVKRVPTAKPSSDIIKLSTEKVQE